MMPDNSLIGTAAKLPVTTKRLIVTTAPDGVVWPLGTMVGLITIAAGIGTINTLGYGHGMRHGDIIRFAVDTSDLSAAFEGMIYDVEEMPSTNFKVLCDHADGTFSCAIVRPITYRSLTLFGNLADGSPNAGTILLACGDYAWRETTGPLFCIPLLPNTPAAPYAIPDEQQQGYPAPLEQWLYTGNAAGDSVVAILD